MLAYVFWHQPRSDAGGYEAALLRFHDQLTVPGLAGSRVVRVPDVPWLRGGGFEDWYYVEDFTALGRLNAGAVDATHAGAHDAVAQLAGPGAGGLYALRNGDWRATAARHAWLDQPPAAPPGAL